MSESELPEVSSVVNNAEQSEFIPVTDLPSFKEKCKSSSEDSQEGSPNSGDAQANKVEEPVAADTVEPEATPGFSFFAAAAVKNPFAELSSASKTSSGFSSSGFASESSSSNPFANASFSTSNSSASGGEKGFSSFASASGFGQPFPSDLPFSSTSFSSSSGTHFGSQLNSTFASGEFGSSTSFGSFTAGLGTSSASTTVFSSVNSTNKSIDSDKNNSAGNMAPDASSHGKRRRSRHDSIVEIEPSKRRALSETPLGSGSTENDTEELVEVNQQSITESESTALKSDNVDNTSADKDEADDADSEVDEEAYNNTLLNTNTSNSRNGDYVQFSSFGGGNAVSNGEEDEKTIFQSRVKLFTTSEKEWKESCIGILKVNVLKDRASEVPSSLLKEGKSEPYLVPKKDGKSSKEAEAKKESETVSRKSQSRIILRQESRSNSGVGTRLTLNVAIFPGFPLSLHASDQRSLTLTAVVGTGEHEGPQACLLRFPSVEAAHRCFNILNFCKDVL